MKINRKALIASAGALATLTLTLALALLLGPTGLAVAGPSFFWTVGPALGDLDCTPGNNAYLQESYAGPDGTVADYAYTVTNARTGTSNFYQVGSYNPSPSGGNNTVNWYVAIPDGTQSGDVLVHEFWWIIDGVYAEVNSPIAWVCDTGEIVATGGCGIGDGRINSESCAGPVALYCGDDGLEVWDIDADGVGSLAFTFSGSFETPTTNALLMSAGDIQLWQLDTGEFQVNADAGEGKTYAFIFNGCPYDGGGYNANIDPNE